MKPENLTTRGFIQIENEEVINLTLRTIELNLDADKLFILLDQNHDYKTIYAGFKDGSTELVYGNDEITGEKPAKIGMKILVKGGGMISVKEFTFFGWATRETYSSKYPYGAALMYLHKKGFTFRQRSRIVEMAEKNPEAGSGDEFDFIFLASDKELLKMIGEEK